MKAEWVPPGSDSPVNEPRRVLLRRGLFWASLALPIATVAPSRAAFADVKADFHYQDHPMGALHCAKCVYFVPPEPDSATGTCRVLDEEVSANGWCRAFQPK